MLKRISLALVVSVLISGTGALGCQPSPFEPPPICERFWDDDAVALVDVQNIKLHDHDRYVALHVIELYRGHPPNDLDLKDPTTTCGANFGRTGHYLVWFSKTKSGKWTAYGDRAETAAKDVEYARSIKNSLMTGRIYGTLDKPRRWRFVTGWKKTERLPDRKSAVIIAENENGKFSAVVGNELNFDLPTLPPGKYKVHVEGLPSNLAVDSEEIEVHGGGCNELALFTGSSANISGRVLGAGKMPRFVQISLIPLADIEKANRLSSSWVLTEGDTGMFQFKHVEPGKYILGSEIGHSPTLDVPYASRYYPEGKDEKKAAVIEIHEGEQVKDIEFNLGSEVARRRVRVRLTWEDGTPAQNATAYLRDAHNPYSSVTDEQTPTDANGEALLGGFVDIDYDVDANAVCKGHSVSRPIKLKVIPASATEAFVKLTVQGTKCPLIVERYDQADK